MLNLHISPSGQWGEGFGQPPLTVISWGEYKGRQTQKFCEALEDSGIRLIRKQVVYNGDQNIFIHDTIRRFHAMNQCPNSCIYVHELNQFFIKQYFPLLHVIYYDFFFSKICKVVPLGCFWEKRRDTHFSQFSLLRKNKNPEHYVQSKCKTDFERWRGVRLSRDLGSQGKTWRWVS